MNYLQVVQVFIRTPSRSIFGARQQVKDNELEKMQLRAVTEEDAELAVNALGFVILEIGWAKG
ncbi:hypothetical protein [Undibacterium sp. RuRC25W]|uniref:hypothetical protein n=1 Tax=Undibacterium sp. RuRC25W TaxID=3413047 RepID=UPI003BF1B370